MPIADPKYFTKEHIEKNRHDAPAHLAELAVHALELVAELVREGLKFRFKGGNSLLVLLQDPRRFSIDVDISTDETREKIDECVQNVITKHGVFIKWQHRQHKTKPGLPMISYEIFFKSHFAESGETFIMLDAILHNTLYASAKMKIMCGDLFESSEICELPTVSSLLGDKMLTLGPNTLGIPLEKNKQAHRLKHVHDIGLLIQKIPDIGEIRKSIKLCLVQENQLQEKNLTLQQVFEDTLTFCHLPTLYNTEPDPAAINNPTLMEILEGLKPFTEHLFSRQYSWNRLLVDTARIAFCFSAVVNETITQEQWSATLNSILEKSSATPNSQALEARLYWKQTQDITGKKYF